MDQLSPYRVAGPASAPYTLTMNGTGPNAPDDPPDDGVIIRGVLSGNTNAYRTLVDRHRQAIFALLYRQLGDYHTSQDLAQEVFVKAFQSLSRYRFEASFSTWLHRIAINHLSSYLASRRFRQWKRTSGEPALSVYEATAPDERQSPEQLLHEKQWSGKLREATLELTPKLRAAFLLCALDGKSYEECAAILEIPVGTVRSRFHEARVQLRRRLEKEFGGK